MSQKKFDYKFSLAIMGEPSTGKSNIFKRMRPFGSKYDWDNTIKPTTEIDFLIDSRPIDAQNVRVVVLDMGTGSRWMRENFYKQVHGFLVVYDITNRDSFEKIGKWIKKIELNCWDKEMPQIIIIGSKCDLEEERKVGYEEGRILAEEYAFAFFEVSAKTSENIDFVLKTFKRKELVKVKEREKAKKKEEEEEGKKSWRRRPWGRISLSHRKNVLSVCAGLFGAYMLWDIFFVKNIHKNWRFFSK